MSGNKAGFIVLPVCAFLPRGRGGCAPGTKLSHKSLVFDWGWLTSPDMGLGSTKGGGDDIFSIYSFKSVGDNTPVFAQPSDSNSVYPTSFPSPILLIYTSVANLRPNREQRPIS